MINKELLNHHLNLLADNELDEVTKNKLLAQIESSIELQQRFNDIKDMKEMVYLAYEDESPIKQVDTNKNRSLSKYTALAASIIMSIGLSLGWFAHQQFGSLNTQALEIVESPIEDNITFSKNDTLSLDPILETRRYMVHFDQYDESKLNHALLETRSIIKSYGNSGIPVQLDFLVNLQAAQLFTIKEEIEKLRLLMSEFQNIRMYACPLSLEMIRNGNELLNDMQGIHVDSVVQDLIPKRIKQGWVYIKV